MLKNRGVFIISSKECRLHMLEEMFQAGRRGYPYEDTWNCSHLDQLHSIAIVSFSKEKVGDFKGQKMRL